METTTRSDRHVPIRTCVGCRTRRPQAELSRCVIDDTGTARVSRTAPGRGAWVCGPGCIESARRGFQRAWRTDVTAEMLEHLRAELSEQND